MILPLSVQRRECSFPPLRDKRSYRRIRAILIALPLRERTHAHPLYGPYLQNFRLLMGGALVLAEAPVHFLFGALTSVTVSLLQAPYQLVPFSLNAIEVVVSEIAPPLLDLPTHLLPLPFHNIGIHLLFLLFINSV
jgi:hypothetical protein